jgi:hypothetical protein
VEFISPPSAQIPTIDTFMFSSHYRLPLFASGRQELQSGNQDY